MTAPYLPVAAPFRLDVSADHVAVIDAAGRVLFEGSIDELATAKLIAAAPLMRRQMQLCLDWFTKANAPGDAGCDFLNGDGPTGENGEEIGKRLERLLADSLLDMWVAP